jgi:hypothetical protein
MHIPCIDEAHFQVDNLGPISHFSYEDCQFSTHHRVSFPSRLVRQVSNPFELVHSDVWNTFSVASNKFQYFVPFVDNYSGLTWLFLMKNRSKLMSNFQLFRKDIKTRFNQKILVLRFDNDKE